MRQNLRSTAVYGSVMKSKGSVEYRFQMDSHRIQFIIHTEHDKFRFRVRLYWV